jgi:hypothetical protein
MLRLNLWKSKIFKISRFLLVFVLMTGWIFSGMWQIWQNPQIPPKIQEAKAGTETFTSTDTWTAPTGVTSVDVECWGGGGGGGKGATRNVGGGGGGGGGGYAKKLSISVTPSTIYDVTVGAGGASTVAGENSSFIGDSSVTITANGGGAGNDNAGSGGAGGSGSCTGGCSTGPYTGGDGAAGTAGPGGGGGGSGGTGENGNSATSQTGATLVTGGGNGGDGGAQNAVGSSPSTPCGGGGGGGGNRTGGVKAGGVGLAGKCTLTWTTPLATTIAIRSQDYATSVLNIVFPAGDPSTVISNPSNGTETQGFGGAGVASPVVTLVNTVATAYNIWYNITAFSNSVVSSENYVIIAKGGACANADAINQSATLDGSNYVTTGTVTAIAATGELDLYLKVTLGTLWGKTGDSTLTILGETQ